MFANRKEFYLGSTKEIGEFLNDADHGICERHRGIGLINIIDGQAGELFYENDSTNKAGEEVFMYIHEFKIQIAHIITKKI